MKTNVIMDQTVNDHVLAQIRAQVPGEILLACITGSRLHGTQSEDSDYDYKVVFKPTIRSLITQNAAAVVTAQLDLNCIGINKKAEITYLSIQHWLHKIEKMESNAVELFFAAEDYRPIVLIKSPDYAALKTVRFSVMTRSVFSFIGMADAEIKRFNKHKSGVITRPNINKDLAHGIRSANSAIEFLRTGALSFPIVDLEYVRAVKFGEIPADEAYKELLSRVAEAKELQEIIDAGNQHIVTAHPDVYTLELYKNFLKDQ